MDFYLGLNQSSNVVGSISPALVEQKESNIIALELWKKSKHRQMSSRLEFSSAKEGKRNMHILKDSYHKRNLKEIHFTTLYS